MKNHHLNDGWQLRQNYKKLQMQSTPPIKFKNLHLSSNFDEIIIFLNLRLIVSWKLGLNLNLLTINEMATGEKPPNKSPLIKAP